jgi:4-diphosphocytidyl-2-C-methyl-D-erythritol kinase
MPRAARVPAFAKINLSLLVLHKRGDGYHELRTIFQTVSLADWLEIEYTPQAAGAVEVTSTVPVEGKNLAATAAERLLEELGARGRVRIAVDKRVPLGAGMGGGSSDAAAVLLALPALMGRKLAGDRLTEIAAGIGSDVPFFLTGGTALGIGRGTELYPVASARAAHVLVVKPEAPVSTAGAYAALGRPVGELTSPEALRKIGRFQVLARVLDCPDAPEAWKSLCENDFEAVVFPRHPDLARMERSLCRLGAKPARMTGSGSAMFAVFSTREQREHAAVAMRKQYPGALVRPVRFVSRGEYRAAWRRALGTGAKESVWPPSGRNGS